MSGAVELGRAGQRAWCPAGVRQYLHWTELLPEWRLLNNGHIWSEYAEVAGHGLLLSGHRNSPCQEHGTTRAGDFVFSNSQGKWRLGTGLRGHGEKAQVSFLHITSVATGPLHTATVSHVPNALQPLLLAPALAVQRLLSVSNPGLI